MKFRLILAAFFALLFFMNSKGVVASGTSRLSADLLVAPKIAKGSVNISAVLRAGKPDKCFDHIRTKALDDAGAAYFTDCYFNSISFVCHQSVCYGGYFCQFRSFLFFGNSLRGPPAA